ncbi:MAG: alginate lyase family protein [Acidobacteria bacterium]|nr:alginate lyase family protein [Acidobacteriota bacterium]
MSRLAKLRAMPPREILTRGAYEAFIACEREMHRRNRLARPGRLRGALASDFAADAAWQGTLLRRERAGLFFAGLSDAKATRARLLAEYPDEVQKARRIADAVSRHEIEFFGRRFSFGERIDWHADPVSQAGWPRAYHRDVPLGRSTVYGDAKYVWEVNRHQFLMDLAKIVLLDGSERHRQALQGLVLDWQREVPYGTGAAWACALEPAFRAWSWLWAYHMLRSAGPIEPAFHLAWLAGFYDHGRFLHRHLERYTSPYNHLVGEASALFAIGLLFPEFREASAWAARGRRVLESTLATQFHPDGGTVEQSTFYHHATLGFYVLSALLARRNGADMSPAVWAAVERGFEFSASLVQPGGRVPPIGGADDGKPIRLEHLPFFDFRPYQAIGAVLFSRGDFKHVAGRFWEDALWLLGADGADSFTRLDSAPPPVAVALRHSGYYVARSGWSNDADYVCFDCGPQAAGLRRDAVPSAAHGHADCLSVIASLGGQPVLVDPGFYCYNGEPEWEVHFRKTRAHNTVQVDGRDQARHVHKMAWTHTYTPCFEGASADAGIGWARGSHDGYAAAGQGVIHRRTVWLRAGGYVVIYDEIVGRPGQVARANFQFAPGSLGLATPYSALFEGRFELAWTSSVPVSATIVDEGGGPSGGWIAPSLGVRERAPRLLLEFPVAYPRVAVLAILADRERGASGGPRILCKPADGAGAEGLLGATIVGAGWEDSLIAAPGNRAIRWQTIDTDAWVAVVRRGPRGVEDARRIGGTYLHADDTATSREPEGGLALAGPEELRSP